MNKFSKIQKTKLSIEKEDYLYDGYLKIKSKDNYEFVVENDCSLAIVHLLDFNEILLRKEFIPPFQDRHVDKEFFLTMISGCVEKGETPIQTIIRELAEEAGILLNTTYNSWENWGNYFWCKSNSSKAHIFYFPLRVDDFRKVVACGDGSEIEKLSSTVRVDLKFINSLKPSDLTTALCIELMKTKI